MSDELIRRKTVAANLYHSYRRGWLDGAASRRKDPKFLHHPMPSLFLAYDKGYDDAGIAKDKALRGAMAAYGHEPSILRSDVEPETTTPPTRAGS
jgi:hypothetical protein